MDLHEIEGDGGVCEADPQDRLVARGTAAQIAQPHLASSNDDFLLQGLQHKTDHNRDVTVASGGSDLQDLVGFGCLGVTGGSRQEGGEEEKEKQQEDGRER